MSDEGSGVGEGGTVDLPSTFVPEFKNDKNLKSHIGWGDMG